MNTRTGNGDSARGANCRKMGKLPPTWRAAVAGFLEYKQASGASDSTLNTRYYQLRHFSETYQSLADVTSADLLTALADCEAQYTRKSLRNCLSTFFAWCARTGVLPDNPAATLPSVRKPQPHPHPCPSDAIVSALRNADNEERLMVLLAAECGLRRSEIAAVHSDDVMRDTYGNASLIVHGKGDKQRIVPLPDDLATQIETAKGYAFRGRFKGHVEASYIGKHITKLLPDGWSAHSLRHRFASTAYGQTHDMLAVSTMLGHASTETTMAYVALPNENLRRLVDAATIDDGERPHAKK